MTGSGFVAEPIILGTFGFSPAELRSLASGDAPSIRAVRAGGSWVYCWGDVLLASVVADRPKGGGR